MGKRKQNDGGGGSDSWVVCQMGEEVNLEEAPGDGADTYWHLVLPEKAVVHHPSGDFPADAAMLEKLVSAHIQYTAGGYVPPILEQHDLSGDRAGELQALQYRYDGPHGPGLYARIKWSNDALERIKAGKQKYLSIGICFGWEDYSGTVYDALVYEISLATIPHIHDLPPIQAGLAELAGRMAQLSLRPKTGSKSEPEPEPEPARQAAADPINEEVVRLRAEIRAMRLKEAKGIVRNHMGRYWSVKDDGQGERMAQLVHFRLEHPRVYDLVISCLDARPVATEIHGTSGLDTPAELPVGQMTKQELLQARRKRADELVTEARRHGTVLPYGDALSLAVKELG